MLKEYSRLLREQRKLRKMTQEMAADKIGISRSYFSDIENGRTIPGGRTLFKINEVLPIFFFSNDVGKNTYEEVD